MPDYTQKDLKERTALEKKLSGQIEKRLEKLKEIQSFNNETAASINQQYTKLQMVAQQEQAIFETQKQAYDILMLSGAEQEAKAAALQEQLDANQALTEAEMDTLELLNQANEARAKGADSYKQLVSGVRQNLALQKQVTDEAKEQQQINDVYARDVGVKIANSLGLVKKSQTSITKEFMKSKNKALFLKNAVKGIASQISLVNIGTKMMQSGFQLMVGLVTKVFGMQGGGGGANLSEFVKMTGHASGQMYGLAKETAKFAKKLKVGFEEGGKAVADLMSNMSGFMQMSKSTQKLLAKSTVKMMAFGVSAETSAKIYQKFTSSMGMNAKQAVKQQRQMFFEASALGMNIAQYQEDFLKFQEEMPGFGKAAVKAYREAAAAAKALGFENASALAKAVDGFKNYEDAAKNAAAMNQVFGKNVFDGNKLLEADLKGPAELATEINRQLAASGESFSDMGELQRRALAESMGKSQADLEKLMKGEKGLDKIAGASKRINSVTNSVKKFNQAIKKTKPPGGGGGQKDFLTMVLKSYNKLTKNRFFTKIKLTKKGIKEAMKKLADYIAGIIHDLEQKFQAFGKKFIRVYKDNINAFGDFIGVDDLAGKLKEGLAAVKDMFPLLLPLVPMLAGAMTGVLGVMIKVVGILPALVKGFAGLAGSAVTFGKSMLGGAGALLTGKGGGKGLVEMGKNLLGQVTGDKNLRSSESLMREAQPVFVVNDSSNPIPTTGGGGPDISDVAEGGGKASFLGKIMAQAKGFLGGGFAKAKSLAKLGYLRGKLGTAGGVGNVARSAGSTVRSMSVMGRLGNVARGVKGAAGSVIKGRGAIMSAAKAGRATGLANYMAQFGDDAAQVASGVAKSGMGGKAAQLGGKILGGASKLLGPVGMAYTAFTGVSKIMDGEVTDGLTDIAAGALMMAGPMGFVAGGAIMLYKHFSALGDGTVSAQDTMDNMDKKGKRLYKAYAEKEAAVRKAAATEREFVKDRLKGARDSQTGMFLQADAEAMTKATSDMTGFTHEAKNTFLDADYAKFQDDSFDNDDVKLMTARKLTNDKKKVQREKQQLMNRMAAKQASLDALGIKIGEDEMKLIDAAAAAAETRFAAVRKSHLEEVRNTEAFKDAYGVDDDKEKINRDAMIAAAEMRLLQAKEIEIQNARLLERQRIIMEKTKKKRLEYEARDMKSLGLTEKRWSMEADIQLLKLEQAKAEGESSSELFKMLGGADALKALRAKKQSASAAGAFAAIVDERAQEGKSQLDMAVTNSQQFQSDETKLRNVYDALVGMGKGDAFGDMLSELPDEVANFYKGSDKEGFQDAIKAGGFDKFLYRLRQSGESLAEIGPDMMSTLQEVMGDDDYAAMMQSIADKRRKNLLDHIDAHGGRGQNLKEMQNIFSASDGKGLSKWAMKFREKMNFSGNDIVKLKKLYEKAVAESLSGKGKYAGKGAAEILEGIIKDNKLGIEKAAGAIKKVVPTTAKSLAEKGMKVSKKDVDMLARYTQTMAVFANVLEKTGIEAKFQPFAQAMQDMIDKTKGSEAKESGEFMKNMGILLFNANNLGGGASKRIASFGVAMEQLIQKISDPEKFAQVAQALAAVGAVHVKPDSENAIKLIEKANEEFPKLKKNIEDIEKSTAGQLFFKGGNINQDINTTTTVKLVVGGKEFGRAALYGMKEAGATTVTTPK